MSTPPFRARVTFTRKRPDGAGAYVSGRYVPGTGVDTDFIGSVQPPSATQEHDIIKMLPENERTKKTVVVYCDFGTLRVANEANNQEADLVVFLGETFKVMKINTWAGNILTHDQAFCVRLDNDVAVVAPDYCSPLTLSNVNLVGDATVSIDTLTNQVTTTAIATTSSSTVAQLGSESFTTQTGIVPLELTYDSATVPPGGVFCLFADNSNIALANTIAGVLLSVGTGAILDLSDNSVLHTGLSIVDGTSILIELDTENETATYSCESLGVSGSLNVRVTYDNNDPVYMGMGNVLSEPVTDGDEVVTTLNAGYKAFTNTSIGTAHCNL